MLAKTGEDDSQKSWLEHGKAHGTTQSERGT